MPSINQLKEYKENAYYHIYNRGVGKMTIFHEEQDYHVFLHYLRIIFSPLDVLLQELNSLQRQYKQIGNGSRSSLRFRIIRMRRAVRQAERLKLWENVDLLSYSLMPNHFHLLVYQKVKNGIEMVMRRLGSGYSGYYTHKYKWAGPVMQGRYNASCLFWEPELQALAAARYIERNFLDLPDYAPRSNPAGNRSQSHCYYPFSSLKYYNQEIENKKSSPIWLNTHKLVSIFDEISSDPHNIIEGALAGHKNYIDFMLSPVDFSLEDVRLTHLESLS